MTDNTEAVANATEAAPAALKTNAVPSDTPKPEPAKPAAPAPKVEEVEDSPEETETEDSAASDGADAPAHPKNKGVGKRINELTREKHDAIREAQYWKEQALKATPAAPAPEAPTQAASQETGEPKPEDYDFDITAFNRAHYKWLRDEERKQEQVTQRQQSFTEKESAFRSEHPDYDDVAKSADVPITRDMAVAILDTENPPAIAYYLGKNPDEAAAIASMTPIAAARAIGRIEAKLEAPPAPVTPREPPRKTTNAPPPPKTVSGAGKPEVSVDDPNISPAQRIAFWQSQRKPK
jgi:hypothetical protein